MVTDSKLIKSLKKTAKFTHLFPNIGHSGCALRRYDGKFILHDITDTTEILDYEKWITASSLKAVDFFDNEAFLLNRQLGTSMVFLMLDFEN